ncbi:nicotinamide riboside transporter PnuC [Acinetobacter sp. MD2]|uniref:nicotinamide riboside transporter PnuC n=1 Tax=Acinetobacter sp. MD2 TaxID=2600066 RepID=UPI002D1F5284|nr:nicotinamide riboside transporter PnuC [Acinetobacter sp. MD2]MEB3766168.1 nicotinamide mononucleotide transporter [Acinetobacter sp. MD2]
MSALEVIAVIISLIGVVLTVLRNMWCWLFNFIAAVLYGYLFFTFKLYGETILQFFFMAMNIYGCYYWLKGKQQTDDICIEPIKRLTVFWHIGSTILGGLVFGLILKHFTDAAVPMLDAQLAAFSLLATYWTSRKHIATWILWIFVNIVYVGMFVFKGLLLTAGLYAVFVGLALYGWWQWQQVQNQQKSAMFRGV